MVADQEKEEECKDRAEWLDIPDQFVNFVEEKV